MVSVTTVCYSRGVQLGVAKMGLSHGPNFDRPRSGIGRASLLRHLLHRHGRNLFGGFMVAVMVLDLAVVTS